MIMTNFNSNSGNAVVKVEYGDRLIVDPCYIKTIWTEFGENQKEVRFDMLRCEKVLHSGDDGEFPVEYNGETRYLGVDSGRIWQMVAEFDGFVEIDAGFSGYWLIRKGENEN